MSELAYIAMIEKSLEGFGRIDLEQLTANGQMNRIDRKFLLHISHIPDVLHGLATEYQILEAAGDIISPYHSYYFDTDDFYFYQRHHSGFKNREKIRYRCYPNTSTTFLELKSKNNKGRTVKLRIPKTSINFPLDEESKAFLDEQGTEIASDQLVHSARIDYHRLAFLTEDAHERFSIDFNIKASCEGATYSFGDVAIVEVKQDVPFSSTIIMRMRELGIRENTLSKYCVSMAKLRPELKSNSFKADFRRLRKIAYEI